MEKERIEELMQELKILEEKNNLNDNAIYRQQKLLMLKKVADALERLSK